jgi:vanillate O-demethylase ferredoxin subunit
MMQAVVEDAAPGLRGAEQWQDARIVQMRLEATDVLSLELRPVDGRVPPLQPGAHVELALPNGLRRAYSLVNPPGDRAAYRIAVHRSPGSRGGSACVHEFLRVGDLVQVSAPRNQFPLVEGPDPVVLIAGGIGITPLWAMVQQLVASEREWELHYAVRERGRAAFLQALVSLGDGRVRTYFDAEPGGASLDLHAVVGAAARQGARVYCCGPQRMLQAFEQATAGWDEARVHLEKFGGEPAAGAPQAGCGFEVVLARSGRTVPVEAGTSILEAVLAAGVAAPYSCREGFCGTCETRVLEGTPDHADSVLSAAERGSGRTMMICCSRSQGGTLVLDL